MISLETEFRSACRESPDFHRAECIESLRVERMEAKRFLAFSPNVRFVLREELLFDSIEVEC